MRLDVSCVAQSLNVWLGTSCYQSTEVLVKAVKAGVLVLRRKLLQLVNHSEVWRALRHFCRTILLFNLFSFSPSDMELQRC